MWRWLGQMLFTGFTGFRCAAVWRPCTRVRAPLCVAARMRMSGRVPSLEPLAASMRHHTRALRCPPPPPPLEPLAASIRYHTRSATPPPSPKTHTHTRTHTHTHTHTFSRRRHAATASYRACIIYPASIRYGREPGLVLIILLMGAGYAVAAPLILPFVLVYMVTA
jgi:hypothetical protein